MTSIHHTLMLHQALPLLAGACLLATCAQDEAGPPEVALTEVLSGLAAPVALAFPDDGSGRWFAVDQVGVIYTVRDGARLQQPFLDLRERMYAELEAGYDERGLLGLALHPQFASNGRFFVYYSAPLRPEAPPDHDHTSHLSEFRVSADDPDRADAGSERVLLVLDQPQRTHNGGGLVFGPDGLLYVSLGDGGGANDVGPGHPPMGHGQTIETLHGSILRVDVDGPEPYGIPADNPFVGQPGADEIFAYGLRNPYRFSFDPEGDRALYAGDVGQERWEEVNVIERGNNYGWNIREGTGCFDPEDALAPPSTCPSTGARGEPLVPPVLEFANSKIGGPGRAVIGGHVYRGAALPALAGRYVFGAWSSTFEGSSGTLFFADLRPGSDAPWPMAALPVRGSEDGGLGAWLLGFAEDPEGELYVLTSSRSGPVGDTGRVYRLTPPD